MKHRKISFIELAKKSGVSIATLSRYFNNGYISEEKKDIIKANILKYNFRINSAARNIKKKSDITYIIRTLASSHNLDNITAGIIENLKSEVFVSYGGSSESEVIDSINKIIEKRPKNLIVYAPMGISSQFEETIDKVKNYTNLIIYDYETKMVKTLNFTLRESYKKIAQKVKKVNFVFDKYENLLLYKRVINGLKEFFEVKVSDKIDKNIFNVFQTNTLHHKWAMNENFKAIIASYERPYNNNNETYWIFIDFFFFGIKISRMCQEENSSSHLCYISNSNKC